MFVYKVIAIVLLWGGGVVVEDEKFRPSQIGRCGGLLVSGEGKGRNQAASASELGVAPGVARSSIHSRISLSSHADALLNLGRLLHEDGDLEGAEARYRAAAEADPKNARPHYNLGVALEDGGDPEHAIDSYARAIDIDRDLAAAHFNVSRLLHAAGRRTDAIRHLTEYRRLIKRLDVAP